MGRALAVKARDEMPQVKGAVALDLKALAKLPCNGFDQTARSSCPAHKAARTAVFDVVAQRCVQRNA
jgi:hypothetical protein